MVKSSSSSKNEVFDDSFCSTSCKKNIEDLNTKITKLNEERSDKNKEGLGYSVVPPPPAQVYSPSKKDMSWTGLPEFADDTITDYSRPSPSVESNSSDLQNSNSSVSENGESSKSIMSNPMIKFIKAADSSTEVKTNKVKAARKPSVKYAEMYRKTSKSSNVRGTKLEDLVRTKRSKGTKSKEVVDYILQVKIKLLIKKLEDSKAEHQV
nr:hypothetical protein [Tanacetum cinerariifolium]